MNAPMSTAARVFGAVALGALPVLAAAPASALVLDMRAAETTLTLPGVAQPVPCWGFGLGAGPVSVPGPLLRVPDGETELVVHLTNELPVAVSLLVPALPAALTPERSAGGRVVSFTQSTPPGETRTYTWSALRPGTFLYHSGTHPAVQVQMGLYGGLTVAAGDGLAYPGVPHGNEAVLLYSEVDVGLHLDVANDDYGPGKARTSTLDYAPSHFLINGSPRPLAAPLFPAVAPHVPRPGERVLLRFLNAGLMAHVPLLYGEWLDVVAEDGRPYPHAMRQYSVLLPAGKTVDAILEPQVARSIPILDRAHHLTDGGAPGGGMATLLPVEDPAGAPGAEQDGYAFDEDAMLAVDPVGGVLANDDGDPPLAAALVTPPAVGDLALSPDGSFVYEPPPDFTGGVFFEYVATSGGVTSGVTPVHIEVLPVNDAPEPVDDAFDAPAGDALVVEAPGLLANDGDLDGDALEAALLIPPTGGTALVNADGSFEYVPDPGTTSDTFTYTASDGALVAPATVSITVLELPNEPPIAEDDYAKIKKNLRVLINVVANDHDPDGVIVPSSVTITTPPLRGGAVVVYDSGVISYKPRTNFKGTDLFRYVVSDDEGATSGPAVVRIDVVE